MKFLKFTLFTLFVLVLPNEAAMNHRLQDKASLKLPQKTDKIDALISKYHEYKLFNGSVLIVQDGRVVLRKGYGKANISWNIDAGSETRFRLGSITKQFTAMLIMMLKQEGRIRLDGTISDYLSWFDRKVGEKVTIHHLLTHTSGLPNYTNSPDFPVTMSREILEPADFAKKYFETRLEFEPGKDIRYSNTGYYLLGLIIEEITKRSYERNLRERIFDPLGMKNSGIESPNQIIEKFAEGYELDFDRFEKADFINMRTATFSAGAIYSTVGDLFLWDSALYGNTLLDDENKKVMFTPFLPNYAYGIAVLKRRNFLGLNQDLTEIVHGGGIHGFSSFMSRIPEKRILIILLDNTRAGTRGSELEGIVSNIQRVLFGLDANDPKPLAALELVDLIKRTSVEKGIESFRQMRKVAKSAFDLTNFESDLNRLGYRFLSEGKLSAAVEILKLCVEEFPVSANAYDSLGEAYFANKEYKLSLVNYQKSRELNPENENAGVMIKRIQTILEGN